MSPYLGVTNSSAIAFFRHLSQGVIILSYESTLENSEELGKIDANLGYLSEFKEPLMVSKHCVVAAKKGHKGKQCGECFHHHYQLSSGGDLMDLRFEHCNMHIEGKTIKRKQADGLVDVRLL